LSHNGQTQIRCIVKVAHQGAALEVKSDICSFLAAVSFVLSLVHGSSCIVVCVDICNAGKSGKPCNTEVRVRRWLARRWTCVYSAKNGQVCHCFLSMYKFAEINDQTIVCTLLCILVLCIGI